MGSSFDMNFKTQLGRAQCPAVSNEKNKTPPISNGAAVVKLLIHC